MRDDIGRGWGYEHQLGKECVIRHTLSFIYKSQWETLRISKSRVKKIRLRSTKRILAAVWKRAPKELSLIQTVKRKLQPFSLGRMMA